MMKEYDASTSRWNEVYSECKLTDISGSILHVEPTFDACLNLFANNTTRVLDFGCGSSDILFECADFGHLQYGLGIDRSETGIAYSKKMANYNHYHNLDFVVGDLSHVTQMEPESFDGIILSNILDVVPKELEFDIYEEMTRLLEPGGYLFVKLNPYCSREKLESFGFTYLYDNFYEDDGVLRVHNLPTTDWITQFKKHYSIERYIEFPYPWQEGLNRLLLLKKLPSATENK